MSTIASRKIVKKNGAARNGHSSVKTTLKGIKPSRVVKSPPPENTGALRLKLAEIDAERCRLQSMMDASPVNIIYADRDLKIRYMNFVSLKKLKGIEPYV